jgi:hypothetical protein
MDVKRAIAVVVAAVVFSAVAYGQAPGDGAQGVAPSAAPEPVFRSPFSLRLAVDKDHYYEQKFDKVPYVADNDVYLFAGDAFGINLVVADGKVTGIVYQPDTKKADVLLRFSQEKSKSGNMMMLVVQSKLKQKLFYEALMTVPQKDGIYKTNMLPVEAGLVSYESWPHPIVQLVLKNFRFSESGE